jgi:hypothetical protein
MAVSNQHCYLIQETGYHQWKSRSQMRALHLRKKNFWEKTGGRESNPCDKGQGLIENQFPGI